MDSKFSLSDFNKFFPNEEVCLRHLLTLKNDQSKCVRCNSNTKFYKVKGRQCFECGRCGKQIFPRKGTIMERSGTPLLKWFQMIYLLTISKNGLSAKHLQRTLGVTYKTAWIMRQKIRNIMNEKLVQKMFGTIEVDETYIGGKKKAKGCKKTGYNGRENKIIVFGMRTKEGFVRTEIIENTAEKDILPIIVDNIQNGSSIHSDEHPTYRRLTKMGYNHGFVCHKKYKFKKGNVTTNGIESYWSYIKGIIRGTYKHVSRKWMSNYLSEFELFYNLRKEKPKKLFDLLLLKSIYQNNVIDQIHKHTCT